MRHTQTKNRPRPAADTRTDTETSRVAIRRTRRRADQKRAGIVHTVRRALTFAVATALALAAFVALGAAIALGLLTSGAPNQLLSGLPDVNRVVEGKAFKTAMIYDREGRLLYELWDHEGGRRFVVPLNSMPQHLVDATLATEDPRFYENPGFDAAAIVRAVMQNLRGQAIVSGGSTITQQLVRASLFDSRERYEQSYVRKAKEIVLAYQLSQRYSKDEILERYLNEIYYGNFAYGIEAASETYFGKPAAELTVGEAAMLAGLPQSPSANDPLANPAAARDRQLEVLSLMVRHGYLSDGAAAAAANESLKFRVPRVEIRAPHFSLYIRGLLESRFSREELYYSGLKIYTTLDLDLQELSEKLMRDELARVKANGVANAALVALDPRTGEILAMQGSADYWDDSIAGQVNMALAERQPGPVLKPLTYLAAFTRGKAAPTTMLADEPTSFYGGAGKPAYRPENADGQFRGAVTARQALALGLNVPAVRLLSQIGVGPMLDTVHALGITGLNKTADYYGLSLALGTGEVRLLDLAYAYGVLANGGLQVGEPASGSERMPGQREFQPVAITRIVDGEGKVIEEYRPSGKQVITPEVSWLMTDILGATLADGPARFTRPAVLVSGTTETSVDNWAVGYTPSLAVGVWMGPASGRQLKAPSSGTGADGLWRAFVEKSLADAPAYRFERPSGLVRAVVDAKTGQRPVPGQPTVVDWAIESTLSRSWNVPSPTALPTATPTRLPTATATAVATPTPTSVPPTATALKPGEVRVPTLVGQTESAARQAIEAAGLANTNTNYQSARDVADQGYYRSIEPGHVLSQLPAAGTVVKQGSTVYLAVRRD